MTTNTQAGSFEGRIDHNPDLADGANSVVAIVSIKSNSPGATSSVNSAKKRVLGFVVDAARELVTAGTGTVVVSLGGDGAVLVTADRVAHAVATVTDPQSTVGAGDCLLAGLLHALSRGDDPADALATGVAWGAAAVGLPGSRVPSPADVARIRVSLDHHPDLTRLIA